MNIKILFHKEEPKNSKVGVFDFSIEHSPGKWEIFREVSYFKSEKGTRWASLKSVQRDGQWKSVLERSTDMRSLMDNALKALDDYLLNLATKSADLIVSQENINDCPF
jgi:hypothetical protein